uniref:Cathepsin B n=1 Tax=Cacopsylla melanoneura TaxID=428564 RepID=A0A8D8XLJ4_9HEMI
MLTLVWVVAAWTLAVSATPYEEEIIAAVLEKGGDALLWEPGTNFEIDTPENFVDQSNFVASGLASYKADSRCSSLCSAGYGHDVDPAIPETFDARQKWPQCDIGKVPDQGACKADYAISATRAIADRFCVASNGKAKTTISAQQVVSCCKNCGVGCRGGIPQEVWLYAMRKGIASGGDYNSNEGCQPYLKEPTGFSPNKFYGKPSYTTPKCSQQCYNQHYGKSKVREDLHKGKTPDRLCCCSVKGELFKKGPVTTSMILFEDFLTYKSGIYHHVHGKRLGHITVKLIGFGVENKQQYWLAVNNWGTSWGDQGTFKILKEKNGCEFDQYFFAGDVQA